MIIVIGELASLTSCLVTRLPAIGVLHNQVAERIADGSYLG
jgi:hypothetical protein